MADLDKEALGKAMDAYNRFECGSDVDHVRKIVRAYLDAADGWRDIASAPKDGTHFLACDDGGDMYRAAYTEDGYICVFCGQPAAYIPEPTVWRPLPTPPEGE